MIRWEWSCLISNIVRRSNESNRIQRCFCVIFCLRIHESGMVVSKICQLNRLYFEFAANANLTPNYWYSAFTICTKQDNIYLIILIQFQKIVLPHSRAVEVYHEPFRRVECDWIGFFDTLKPYTKFGTNECASSISSVNVQPNLMFDANIANLLAVRPKHKLYFGAHSIKASSFLESLCYNFFNFTHSRELILKPRSSCQMHKHQWSQALHTPEIENTQINCLQSIKMN